MNWSRTRTLVAGFGLIALTNAVALVGVAYNRSGEPEAKLRLTQRELQPPYQGYYGKRENSGLALSLNWRVLNEQPGEAQLLYGWRYAGKGGTPAWLDKAKMKSLGFYTPDSATSSGPLDSLGRMRYEKQLPREALLVLELNGPTYQRSLELAAQYVAREDAKLAANPGDKNFVTRVKNAHEALEWETHRNSRLFLVDAGPELDAAALRAKYPDVSRYPIVYGQVRLTNFNANAQTVQGYVNSLSIESVNAPFALRSVFENAAKIGDIDQRNSAPFEATVAFGKRLEPWIIEAAKK